MGPRLFNRGKEFGGGPIDYGTYPLQWGRGYSTAERRWRGDIRQSTCKRFNGAAVIQPRKVAAWKAGAMIGYDASMGPRLFNRGKTAPENRRGLSMPTGFNGAAVIQPRKVPPKPKRRSPWTCFNGAAVIQPRKGSWEQSRSVHQCAASMGPRLFNRGKPVMVHHPGMVHAASMGPRLFNRGKSPVSWSMCRLMPCFNGAAVIQPRKGRVPSPHTNAFSPLQWGRGYSTAESCSGKLP